MLCTEMNDVSKPSWKICIWASMIAINMSIAVCQFANFLSSEKSPAGPNAFAFVLQNLGGSFGNGWQLALTREQLMTRTG